MHANDSALEDSFGRVTVLDEEEEVEQRQMQEDVEMFGSRPVPVDPEEAKAAMLLDTPTYIHKRSAPEVTTFGETKQKKQRQEGLTAMDWNSGGTPIDAWLNQSAMPCNSALIPSPEVDRAVRNKEAREQEENELAFYRKIHITAAETASPLADPLDHDGELPLGGKVYYRNIIDKFPLIPRYLARRLAEANVKRAERLNSTRALLKNTASRPNVQYSSSASRLHQEAAKDNADDGAQSDSSLPDLDVSEGAQGSPTTPPFPPQTAAGRLSPSHPSDNLLVRSTSPNPPFRPPSPGAENRSRRSSTSAVNSRDYISKSPVLKHLNVSPSYQSTPVQKSLAVYRCNLCPKKFTRAYNLRSHLRTHTEERPFFCTVCGKAFARQYDRQRHENLHPGDKDLHLELGNEQEGIVSRVDPSKEVHAHIEVQVDNLTRELTELRAQAASMTSTNLSTSTLFTDQIAVDDADPPLFQDLIQQSYNRRQSPAEEHLAIANEQEHIADHADHGYVFADDGNTGPGIGTGR